MNVASIITLLGGLAFFLFGMSLMGDALKKVAGGKLETTLGRLTSTPLKGVLLGAFVTAVIQSSSATTVMVVGFVNSGIMQLPQAIAIIMGANIGTTATGWILSLANVGSSGAASLFSTATIFAVVAVIGIVLYMTGKTTAQKNIGVILLALSVLMSGMKTMSAAMKPLQESESFLRVLTVVENPVVAIGIGIAVTAVLQSCSASVGILQALSATGAIGSRIALFMIIGSGIGACVPVLLSAIGAKKNAKRAAFSYLFFNLLGGGMFLLLFLIADGIWGPFPLLTGAATSVGIAQLNTAFKIAAVLLVFPLRSLLERMAVRAFPDAPEDEEEKALETDLLDERFLNYPPVALEQAAATVERMAKAAQKNLIQAVDLLMEYRPEAFAKVETREERVDRFEDKLGSYLVKLSSQGLSDRENRLSAMLLQSLTNLERISDHAMNIAELGQELSRRGERFSSVANESLAICEGAVEEILGLTIRALTRNDLDAALRVEPLEDTIDILTERLKAQHVARLQSGQCTLSRGFVFNDCVNNFERVADHCSNIALIVLENQSTLDLETHSNMENLKKSHREEYEKRTREYGQEYLGALARLAEPAGEGPGGAQISLFQ